MSGRAAALWSGAAAGLEPAADPADEVEVGGEDWVTT
jgi:hypothetical protein